MLVAGCAAFGCRSNAAKPPPVDAASSDARDARDARAKQTFEFDPIRGAPPAKWSSKWTAIFLDEWIAKREAGVDSFPNRNIHLVFEEWFDTGHVRVSVRGDGWYAIELDGWIRWSGPRYRPGRGKWPPPDFYSAKKGGFPILHHFGDFGESYYMMRNLSSEPPLPAFPPCPDSGDDGSGPYLAGMSLSLDGAHSGLRSWWTSPQCPGFPRGVARDAWDLIEKVAGGWVSRPTWYPASAIAPPRDDEEPDCRGFGGKVHGTSRCIRVNLETGRSGPISQRVPVRFARTLACDSAVTFGEHKVTMICGPASRDPAGREAISLSIDGRSPIVIDTHEHHSGFINVWAKADYKWLDLTIDYGVLD